MFYGYAGVIVYFSLTEFQSESALTSCYQQPSDKSIYGLIELMSRRVLSVCCACSMISATEYINSV